MTALSAEPLSAGLLDARGTFEVLVRDVRLEAENVVSLGLARPDGGELPGWAPGAHVDLVLPSGRVRQYSLCGDPAQRGVYRIAVLREDRGRGGSAEIHDTALVGRVLYSKETAPWPSALSPQAGPVGWRAPAGRSGRKPVASSTSAAATWRSKAAP